MKQRSNIDVSKENIFYEKMTKNRSLISPGSIVASQGYIDKISDVIFWATPGTLFTVMV